MIEADSVLSTPRTDSSLLSRRHAIAGLALLSAAAPAAATAAEPDPVYAAIEHFRQLSDEYTAVVQRGGSLLPEDPAYHDAMDETEDACDALFEQMDVIFAGRRPLPGRWPC